MIFTINVPRLSAIFQTAAKSTGDGTNSLLSELLLKLRDGRLLVSATDGATTVTFREAVDRAEGQGAICLPAKHLVDSFKEFKDIQRGMTLETNADGTFACIDWGAGECSLPVTDAAEWPAPRKPVKDVATTVVLPAATLLEAIDAVFFAAEDNGDHPMINALRLDVGPDGMAVAATNLALIAVYNCDVSAPSAATVAIPLKACLLLRLLLKDAAGDARLEFDDKSVTVVCGDVRLATYAVQNFPDYRKIMGREPGGKTLSLPRGDMLSCIKRVHVLSGRADDNITLCLSQGKVRVTSRTKIKKASVDETLAAGYDHEDLTISFKESLLEDVLKHAPYESLRFLLGNAQYPCFIGDVAGDTKVRYMMSPTLQAA